MEELDSITVIENEEEESVLTEETFEKPYYGSVSGAILGGIIGLVAALVIGAVIHAIFKSTHPFFYIVYPICISIFIILFKGNKSVGGIVVTVVLSALGTFLAPAFAYACEFCIQHGIFALSVPFVALSHLSGNNFFTGISFTSAYILPVVVVIIGIFISWQLFRYYRTRD